MTAGYGDLASTVAIASFAELSVTYSVAPSGVEPDGYAHGEISLTYRIGPLGVADFQASATIRRTSSVPGSIIIPASGDLTVRYIVVPRPQLADALHPSGDVFVWQARPTLNFDGRQDLDVGAHPDGELRTLIQFPALPTAPHPAEIKAAVLRVWARAIADETPATLVIRPLLAPWQADQATWINQPAADAPAATATVGSGEGWVEIDLTALFDEWWNGGRPNYGIRVEADRLRILDASEGPHPPELIVTWSPPPEAAYQPGENDLAGEAYVPGRTLPASMAVRQAAEADLTVEAAIRLSAEADLAADVAVAANAIGGSVGVSRPDLPSEAVIVFAVDLPASASIGRPDLPGSVWPILHGDLPASGTVRQAAGADLDAEAIVRQAAGVDLPGSVRAVYRDVAELPGQIAVRWEAVAELGTVVAVSRPSMAAQVWPRIVADLPAAVAIRRTAYAQVEGRVGVNDPTLEASARIVIAGQSQIPGVATILKHRAADLQGAAGVRVEGEADLHGWASVVLGPNDLPIEATILSGYLRAEVWVAERSEIWLYASIRQINVSEIPIIGWIPGARADLPAEVLIGAADRIRGYVVVPHRANLLGTATIRVGAYSDLSGTGYVRYRSDVPIYGNVRRDGYADFPGEATAAKPAVPSETAVSRGWLDGLLAVRQADAADLAILAGVNLPVLVGWAGINQDWLGAAVTVGRPPVTASIPAAVTVRAWADYTDELYWSLTQPNRAEHPASSRRVVGRA